VALSRVKDPPGEHHVGHSVHADQPRHPDGSAASHEQSMLALGQGVKRGVLRHPDVRGAGQLESSAHDRPPEYGDYRQPAGLDPVESAVPHHRMLEPREDISLGQLGQIQARGEMITLAVEDDRAGLFRRGREKFFKAQNGLVVQSVPLRRSAQPKDGHVIIQLDSQR
jgi:hypothetical protein